MSWHHPMAFSAFSPLIFLLAPTMYWAKCCGSHCTAKGSAKKGTKKVHGQQYLIKYSWVATENAYTLGQGNEAGWHAQILNLWCGDGKKITDLGMWWHLSSEIPSVHLGNSILRGWQFFPFARLPWHGKLFVLSSCYCKVDFTRVCLQKWRKEPRSSRVSSKVHKKEFPHGFLHRIWFKYLLSTVLRISSLTVDVQVESPKVCIKHIVYFE